jgi:hypothetical protein
LPRNRTGEEARSSAPSFAGALPSIAGARPHR